METPPSYWIRLNLILYRDLQELGKIAGLPNLRILLMAQSFSLFGKTILYGRQSE